MLTLTLLASAATLLSLGLTPVCRSLCKRLGWVDYPNARKVHRDPIPRPHPSLLIFDMPLSARDVQNTRHSSSLVLSD
jgi:UDP-N-acetylmuramyl pentapeptide phosphotransferase/UDP-N-acetylglucosamine-1-phosphate transferase